MQVTTKDTRTATSSSLNGYPKRGRPGRETEETYDYTDEDGNLLFQVVRQRPKGFRQRSPDGKGGWKWSTKGARQVLYRLPHLLEAVRRGGLVFVVEGEKDAGNLTELGFCATTNAGGAGKWRDEYSDVLAGAVVVVLPDNDEPGRTHAGKIAASSHRQARCVRVVELPGLPEGGDVSDWLEMGGTAHELLDLVRSTPDWTPEAPVRTLPPPLSLKALSAVVASEPPEEWLVRGLIPCDSNLLLAAYPKSGKTMLVEELAIALASGTPFLQQFPVQKGRVGLVLMEDRKRSTLRRLQRLCQARGSSASAVEDALHIWSRPPLSLGDDTVEELGDYAAELELDLLVVDNWSYVATGDSNDSDSVTRQLQRLSEARVKRPGLVVCLVHHARKTRKGDGAEANRVTDLVRNSSAISAWYDVGVLLARKDETTPIRVRTEVRDGAPLDPFAFVIEDEHPGEVSSGVLPRGWLRLRVLDEDPEEAEKRRRAEEAMPRILQALGQAKGQSFPSFAAVYRAVEGDDHSIRQALALMDGKQVKLDRAGRGNACKVTLIASESTG